MKTRKAPMDLNVSELYKKVMQMEEFTEQWKDEEWPEDTKEVDYCGSCEHHEDQDEEGMMREMMSFMRKGGKGKGGKKGGKGFGSKGGKGKFEGDCSYCGKYGRRKRDCWELDKVMSEYRKGKGCGKGGKGYGEKGGGKGWGDKGGKGWEAKGGKGKGTYNLGKGGEQQNWWLNALPDGSSGESSGWGSSFLFERNPLGEKPPQ